MRSIVVDTGPLFALFDRRDRHHSRAVAFLNATRDDLVTNVPVLIEVSHLLRRVPDIRIRCLRWTCQRLTIDKTTPDDLDRILTLLHKYSDVGADVADASLIALAERLDTVTVATFDSDFTICRHRGRRSFENVLFYP